MLPKYGIIKSRKERKEYEKKICIKSRGKRRNNRIINASITNNNIIHLFIYNEIVSKRKGEKSMKEQLEHAVNEFELQLMNDYEWYQEYRRILKRYYHLDKELKAIELYNIIKNTFYWQIQKDETMSILIAYNGDIEEVEGFDTIQLYIDEDMKELDS